MTLQLLSYLTIAVLLASAARAEDVLTKTDLPLPPPLELGSPRDKAEAPRNNAAAAVVAAVVAHIDRFKQYPADAQGATGTVIVGFRLDASGRLLESSVVTPTCSDALNKAALATIRRAAPFPPAASYADEYTLPIVFLTRAGETMPAGCLSPADKTRHLERKLGLHPPS
ncbi:energy transducer TonB family protein [Bradyrhizobium sp. 2TAF24]|uniref:energy transducer TonB family protein n=1 Tax=Bradyrhizobium sp. 2TAF24 TaxID=3233011 RepID=UPI003F91AA99